MTLDMYDMLQCFEHVKPFFFGKLVIYPITFASSLVGPGIIVKFPFIFGLFFNILRGINNISD